MTIILNGFGRIGRQIFKIALDQDIDINIINSGFFDGKAGYS